MKSFNFPSWQDVGLSAAIPDYLRGIRYGGLLNFLLGYRVFLQENKVNYLYLCANCGNQKHNLTPFESYTECASCSSKSLRAISYYTLSCKNSRSFSKGLVSSVCSRMASHHDVYSGISHSKVIEMSWNNNKSEFIAKFIGGDEVHAIDPSLAVARAAVCCPFLWDGRFNFSKRKWKKQSDFFSLSHMIYQFSALPNKM